MSSFDPRVMPARSDLAAKHLEGKVSAAQFVEGEVREVIDAQAPVRHAPSPDAQLDSEALKGERVAVYETTQEGWCWGQLEADFYVGWLPAQALALPGLAPTRKVTALRTLVFPGPSIKLPPIEALSFGCRLAIARTQEDFAVTAQGGYVPARHLAPIDRKEPDFVAVADRFVGVPYLWGGKTSLGLDCSALVQLALAAAGIACPRDSDMQEQALGTPIATGQGTPDLKRGDLVFWGGHVAIVRDAKTCVHANAHHMAVAIEPIADAMARIRAAGGEVTSVRRLSAQ
jgi:cell wall-associated NlpC family hydrolase